MKPTKGKSEDILLIFVSGQRFFKEINRKEKFNYLLDQFTKLCHISLSTAFLHLMLADCCRLSMKLIYNASSHDDADLHFPVIVNLEADRLMSSRKNLVPLLPQTGIAFLVLERSKSDYTWRIVKSLFATWPVLILILVLSLLAGIAAWSLVGLFLSFAVMNRNFVFWDVQIREQIIHYKSHCYESKKKKEEILKKDKKKNKKHEKCNFVIFHFTFCFHTRRNGGTRTTFLPCLLRASGKVSGGLLFP